MITIVGLDFSITSPGLVLFNLDNNLNRIDMKFMGMTSVIKTAKLQKELFFLDSKSYSNDIIRFDLITEEVIDWIERHTINTNTVYIALEGYSMGSKGKVFNIAEATGILKLKGLECNMRLRIYEPMSIKKFSVGKGNVDKVTMGDEFDKLVDQFKPILNDNLKQYESPKADIVDAYWIAMMLYNEILVRHGIKNLREFDEKQIEVFNAVSIKGNKDNILSRSFIEK